MNCETSIAARGRRRHAAGGRRTGQGQRIHLGEMWLCWTSACWSEEHAASKLCGSSWPSASAAGTRHVYFTWCLASPRTHLYKSIFFCEHDTVPVSTCCPLVLPKNRQSPASNLTPIVSVEVTESQPHIAMRSWLAQVARPMPAADRGVKPWKLGGTADASWSQSL